MKHKTIKKSIIIIMVCTLLFTCVSSLASASVGVGNVSLFITDYTLSPDDLIEYYPDSTNNNIYAYHYQVEVLPVSTATGSGGMYLNGSYIWNVQYNINVPNNCTLRDSNITESNPVYTESCFSFINWETNGDTNVFRVFAAYSNLYVQDSGGKRTPVAKCTIDFIVTVPNSMPAPDISITFTSYDAAGSIVKTSYPEVNNGIAGVIGMSVMHAIDASDFNTALDTLELLAATNNSILDDVLNELYTNNSHLSDLVYYMNNIQNTRLQTIISKIQELIDMGRQDTQAQNDLNAAASQMEGAAAAMNVNKPNMNSVIPQTLANADAIAAQGTIFSWLNNSYIIAILSAMMTIALIGFVLYGKSG